MVVSNFVTQEETPLDSIKLASIIAQLRLVGTDQQAIEVKSSVGKSILETLSSFSNTNGGLIIIGLTENDDFSPVANFNARKNRDQLLSRCSELTPTVRPTIELLPFEDTTLLVAEVPEIESRFKPCYVTNRGSYQGSYQRTGDGDLRLESYEIDRLKENTFQPLWDEEEVDGTTVSDLDNNALESYLKKQKLLRPKTFLQGEETALRRLRVTRNKKLTLGALLAMGEYPQEFFPRLTVSFAVFPGTSKGDIGTGLRLIDSAILNGPIPELVEETLRRVDANMHKGALIGTVYRKEIPDYPLVAVREALVNALMHRDYSPLARGSQVQVNMFVDRLEITSPGGLFGGVTVSNLGQAGVSSTRNQRLSSFLESVEFPDGGIIAENRGTGIAVMNAELTKALMPPLEVKNNLTSFTVIFHRRRVLKNEEYLSARERIRLELEQHSSLSTSELMSMLTLSRTGVQNALNALIKEGVVQTTETKRSPRQRYRLKR